jgi:hypothetical protein
MRKNRVTRPPEVFAFNRKLKRDEPNVPAKLRSKGLQPSQLSRLQTIGLRRINRRTMPELHEYVNVYEFLSQ